MTDLAKGPRTDRVRTAFFEQLAADWDDQQPAGRPAHLRQLLSPLSPLLQEATTVLEVGAGTGELLAVLLPLMPHAYLVGVDLAHAMLQRARERLPGGPLVEADAHRLPCRMGSVDLIICHNSFPHFADRPQALAEAHRVLRPGGHLLIMHDIGRAMLVAIHQAAGRVVREDLLPCAQDMSALLIGSRFNPLCIEDMENHYLVLGQSFVAQSS